MTEEVKAAAIRRRLVASGALMEGVQYPLELSDARILADAFLAEHPADEDESVTREWCRAAGMMSKCGNVSYPRIVSKFGISIDVTGSAYINNQDYTCLWCEDVEVKIGNVTRGDVRLLCNALGIELKE